MVLSDPVKLVYSGRNDKMAGLFIVHHKKLGLGKQ